MTLAKQAFLLFAALLLLAVLFLAGRDPTEELEHGPRWKRRLVDFGLAWLGLFGLSLACGPKTEGAAGRRSATRPVGGPATRPPSGTAQGRPGRPTAGVRSGTEARPPARQAAHPPRDGQQPRKVLRVTRDWPAHIRTWKDVVWIVSRAREVASRPPGTYPFDQAARQALLKGLTEARKVIQEMVRAGQLTAAEAEFLQAEVAALGRQVAEFRPVEMKLATCYEVVPLSLRARQEAGRLQKRLALLQKVAAQRSVDRRVLALVRAEIDSELRAKDTQPRKVDARLRSLRERFRRLWRQVLKKRKR